MNIRKTDFDVPQGRKMNIKREIRLADEIDTLVAAQLASAFTLLALAPYDGWGHEGSPAEMAAFVVAQAKKRGHMSFVQKIVLGEHWYQDAQ